jgi:predicted nucleotidyltransferase
MTPLEEALAEITGFLEELAVPYMLIGGLAMAAWDEPRATVDVDLTAWIEPGDRESTLRRLCERFRPGSKDPIRFASQTQVCPLLSSNGTRIDIVLGALPIERAAIDRARLLPIGGRNTRVASVEDLLLTKMISERPRDREDVTRLLKRYGASLDRGYLRPLVEDLAQALAQPEIVRLLDEAGMPS